MIRNLPFLPHRVRVLYTPSPASYHCSMRGYSSNKFNFWNQLYRAYWKSGHIAKVYKSAAAAVTHYKGHKISDNQFPATVISEPDFSRDGDSIQLLLNIK